MDGRKVVKKDHRQGRWFLPKTGARFLRFDWSVDTRLWGDGIHSFNGYFGTAIAFNYKNGYKSTSCTEMYNVFVVCCRYDMINNMP